MAQDLETDSVVSGSESTFGERHYADVKGEEKNKICLVRTPDLDSYVLLYGEPWSRKVLAKGLGPEGLPHCAYRRADYRASYHRRARAVESLVEVCMS